MVQRAAESVNDPKLSRWNSCIGLLSARRCHRGRSRVSFVAKGTFFDRVHSAGGWWCRVGVSALKPFVITRVAAEDRRFRLEGGAGTDAVHQIQEYALGGTRRETDSGETGSGLVLTL